MLPLESLGVLSLAPGGQGRPPEGLSPHPSLNAFDAPGRALCACLNEENSRNGLLSLERQPHGSKWLLGQGVRRLPPGAGGGRGPGEQQGLPSFPPYNQHTHNPQRPSVVSS